MNTIKNVVFDLGNVLLNFKPKKFMLNFTNNVDKINSFTSKVIGKEIWLKMDRGVITLKKAENLFYEKFPEERAILDWFLPHWMEMLTPIDENVAILESLNEQGYPLYILSNFIKEAFDFVTEKYNFLHFFNGGILSCNVHYLKPEPEIYESLIKEYNLEPKNSLFIDDHYDFLITAKEFKFRTIHYNSSQNLKEKLLKFGIKIN
ncbi:MAG: HAD family phosphatase [Candidatus Lokiarchaeota archaeon]